MKSFYSKLGIVGGGRMGEAIIRGLLGAGMKPELILVSDADKNRKDFLQEKYGVKAASDNSAVAKTADILILAVKPQVMEPVLSEIGPQLKKRKPLVISIAAGIKLELLRRHISADARLVRVMPNTPAVVGEAVSAFYAGAGLSKDDKATVKAILCAFGRAVEVDKEEMMDAVTGLSGSGPAYIFMAIEALADGGVKLGLPRSLAMALAAQTAVGAGRMVIETGKHPGELKDMVTSPGGTTIEGLGVLERGGFRGLLIQAVEAGGRRSRELAGEAGSAKGRGGKRK